MKGMRLGVNNWNSAFFLCITRAETDLRDKEKMKRQDGTRKDRDTRKGRKADMERKMSIETGN